MNIPFVDDFLPRYNQQSIKEKSAEEEEILGEKINNLAVTNFQIAKEDFRSTK
jgi:hypothetical protein